MFVEAIEEVSQYTRPIHTITRNFNSNIIIPGAATLFFVNEEGYAVTCRHVVDFIGSREQINRQYDLYKAEKDGIGKNNKFNQRIKALETKYNFTVDTVAQLKEMFVGVTTQMSMQFQWMNHPALDLAVLKFNDLQQPLYQSYAKFVKDTSELKQGKFLCRLGFPFPEFTNYRYNAELDDIEWTDTGIRETPRFPIEGMLTRHMLWDGQLAGIELSTPGLRGQSGGPLFDTRGRIAGMQSSTHHLHLGFDMKNFELRSPGGNLKVNNQPFLHVGQCVHAEAIKTFLRQQNIKFYEE